MSTGSAYLTSAAILSACSLSYASRDASVFSCTPAICTYHTRYIVVYREKHVPRPTGDGGGGNRLGEEEGEGGDGEREREGEGEEGRGGGRASGIKNR